MTDRPISNILDDIADLLDGADYPTQAHDIRNMSKLAQSDDSKHRDKFESEITGNKWYWLGMGTIADVAMPSEDLRQRFWRAYYELAVACQQNGYDSIYARHVKSVFGAWVRNNHG